MTTESTAENLKSLRYEQRKALESLLITPSVQKAADAAGVSRQTIYRWGRDQAFRDALRAQEEAAIDRLSNGLTTLAELAVNALEDGLRSPDLRVRLRAAGLALDALTRTRELLSFEQRLTALESEGHR